jgi:putative ABC transport system substrate-binding protein
VLVGLAEDDPESTARLAAFRQGLEKRGWFEDRNLQIDYRFAPAGAQAQVLAKELIALQPDVIFAQSTPVVAALQRESGTIPIVFAAIADPIGSGFVASLSRPGGNITGVIAVRSQRYRQVARDAQGDRAQPCARRLRVQPQDSHLL